MPLPPLGAKLWDAFRGGGEGARRSGDRRGCFVGAYVSL